MFTVQRIYAYQPDSKQTAVFIDRLYPRGVHKEVFATALWLKDITPSANSAPPASTKSLPSNVP